VRLADVIPGRATWYLVFNGPSLIRISDDNGSNECLIPLDDWYRQMPPLPPVFLAEIQKLARADLARIRKEIQ
jgi:hypothetical protein